MFTHPWFVYQPPVDPQVDKSLFFECINIDTGLGIQFWNRKLFFSPFFFSLLFLPFFPSYVLYLSQSLQLFIHHVGHNPVH